MSKRSRTPSTPTHPYRGPSSMRSHGRSIDEARAERDELRRYVRAQLGMH